MVVVVVEAVVVVVVAVVKQFNTKLKTLVVGCTGVTCP